MSSAERYFPSLVLPAGGIHQRALRDASSDIKHRVQHSRHTLRTVPLRDVGRLGVGRGWLLM